MENNKYDQTEKYRSSERKIEMGKQQDISVIAYLKASLQGNQGQGEADRLARGKRGKGFAAHTAPHRPTTATQEVQVQLQGALTGVAKKSAFTDGLSCPFFFPGGVSD